MSRNRAFVTGILATCGLVVPCTAQDSLPFSYTVETFQHEDDDDVRAFVLKLEQPFLAEEFEKNNYLRLKALDKNSFLIYPRETRFQQKHAEFYGRLRGDGKAMLQLSYETISENPDGSRKVINRQRQIEVDVPTEAQGPETIYSSWAKFQNRHFADLLEYSPGESFFEYLLLQSKHRYGVTPPSLARLMPNKDASEEGLYRLFSSGLELQQSLQRNSLRAGAPQGDLTIHISQVPEPKIESLNYKELLDEKAKAGELPKPHAVADLIPEDQYLLQFNSFNGANNLRTSFEEWLEPLWRLFSEDARDHHLWSKYESQLLIDFANLEPLFKNGQVQNLALTGSDFFVAEGTDLTVVLKTDGSDAVATQITKWVEQLKAQQPELQDREFNYRGLKIQARYTADRKISSFVVQHEDWIVISNSHVGIRRIIDTLQHQLPALGAAEDYRYATVLLPPPLTSLRTVTSIVRTRSCDTCSAPHSKWENVAASKALTIL
ncbi:MAG: hypothetical protein GY903_05945 [Fuerstiella sp.]|nr:hypothetical protein [Fuerstiella sp.]MCP4854016.1 hypothetical protein [Fuerstiella sp.]